MRTNTRINLGAGLVFGLLLGLGNGPAAAMDEIVVYGSDAAARATQALFLAEMDEYVRTLRLSFKTRLQENPKLVPKPMLQVAASELPTRG